MAEEWDIQRIKSLSGDEDAHFVEGQVQAAVYARHEKGQSVFEPLRARRALAIGRLFLVEAEDELDDWYMGQMAKDGVINCWGRYGTLRDAIQGL